MDSALQQQASCSDIWIGVAVLIILLAVNLAVLALALFHQRNDQAAASDGESS